MKNRVCAISILCVFGVGETAASVLFAQFGVETGAMIMLVVRLWFFALRLPGALFHVFQGRRPVPPDP